MVTYYMSSLNQNVFLFKFKLNDRLNFYLIKLLNLAVFSNRKNLNRGLFVYEMFLNEV